MYGSIAPAPAPTPDDVRTREELLKRLLKCLYDYRHLRRALFVLSGLVTNAVAARCIAELYHEVQSIDDIEQCISIKNFLKLAGIIFSIVTFLSLPSIEKAGRDLRTVVDPATTKKCNCSRCMKIVSHILFAIGPAAATGAALTGSIHNARDLIDDNLCSEFTAADIVPGVLAGFYVWVYQALVNLELTRRVNRTGQGVALAFNNLGYILKSLPIFAPVFGEQLADTLSKQTLGTLSEKDIVTNSLWCVAYAIMLCVMCAADQGNRQMNTIKHSALWGRETNIYSATFYPKPVHLPTSWWRFLLALVGSGCYGLLAAQQVAEVVSREGEYDSPRFPVQYNPYSYYSCVVIGTLFVIANYFYKFYIGLQGWCRSHRLPCCHPALIHQRQETRVSRPPVRDNAMYEDVTDSPSSVNREGEETQLLTPGRSKRNPSGLASISEE